MLAAIVAIAAVLLQPPPAGPVYRPALAARVPGAILPAVAGPVLPAAGTAAVPPTVGALGRALTPFLGARALGSGVSVDVVDALTGRHLLTRATGTPRTPASTAKLLTAAAALTALGPQTTVPTTVVIGGDDGPVYLIGGGDVLLSAGRGHPDRVEGRAGLADLARQVAATLSAQGRRRVAVVLDDRLFSGPALGPGWAAGDVGTGFVAPIQALEIDAGRVGSGHYAKRSSDPAMAAARRFAALLGGRGITVTGGVRRGAAPPPPGASGASASPSASASGSAGGSGGSGDGPVVAGRVESAPVSALVEYALTESDNTVAEALGRLVAAAAGRPAGFAQAGPAVLAQLRGLGVPVEGAVLTDTSGLGAGSKVPAGTLTSLLALATGTEQPQLRPILSGMPVAAVSGTLLDRFTGPGERVAAGMVRAKTGTLTGVSSLAGTVVDDDGRLLVFAAMADRVRSTGPARRALDRLAVTLAGCGCH